MRSSPGSARVDCIRTPPSVSLHERSWGCTTAPTRVRRPKAAFDRVFKQHQAPEDVPEVPVQMEDEVYLPALLQQLGLVTSSGEGRRMIDGGGVKVDGEPASAVRYMVARAYIEGRVVQVGKRRFARPVSIG